MPYDQGLADRLEQCIPEISGLSETRMFGGFGYMLNGNMCVGIHKETLIVRVGVETAEKILQEPNVQPMNFTGRVMKGWATIEPEAMIEDQDITKFCQYAIDFVLTLPPK